MFVPLSKSTSTFHLKKDLRELHSLGRGRDFAISIMGENFYLLYCTLIQKGVFSIRKEFAPSESKFFPIE